MKMSELFPSSLFNLPAGLTGRGQKYLYQSGIFRSGNTVTLFSLGVELFKNITDVVEEYLKSNGFKKIIQKDPSYQDIIKEVTSPKQLPLFFYSFSGGFHIYKNPARMPPILIGG
ncbi:hypothetical protein AN618_05080 [Fervidicola ferrireducens]|uniref:Uncharacterized protein n=1 Tax=Fervidicola ferrireducens TaxID=520764 RepID=A0A140LC41_9FIRM|nr:hypothetical protein AN618_05080 [Fervidicola ferrireducens]